MHADPIRSLLLANSVPTTLVAGCGPANFMRHIAVTDIEWPFVHSAPEMAGEPVRVSGSFGWKNSELVR